MTARVSDRAQAVGSGVILSVAPNVIVLTARHLAARKNLSLKTFSGETLRIVAEYEVADRDLALIVANGPCTGCEAAQTADIIKVGQPIHVWGNPEGRPYVLSPGTIVDLRPAIPGFETNGRFALACASCDVGDSGGGVFDDQGRLLGIITEGWDGLNAGDKRVIAEPVNQALARLPLEYVSSAERAPQGWPATTSLEGPANVAAITACAAAASQEVAASMLADSKTSYALPNQKSLTRKWNSVVQRAMRDCADDASTKWELQRPSR